MYMLLRERDASMSEIVESVTGDRTTFVDDAGNKRYFESETKTELFAALYDRTDGQLVRDEYDLVPLPVALEGKPAIAVYLWCTDAASRGEIADALDVSRATVRQYLSDFRTKRR